jgi:uncharacterized protein YuzE
MKINYYPETDSFYIRFSDQESAESLEISEGVVVNYDETGKLVGMNIDNATHKVKLEEFILHQLPKKIQSFAA